VTASAGQRVEHGRHGRDRSRVGAELPLERRLPHRRLVGEAHAVGREHAGERMDEDARHAERVGDAAGVLAPGAAEALQRVAGDVIAARDRDLADGAGHRADGDVDEAFGELLGRARGAGGGLDLGRHRREALAHDRRVERLVAGRTEDARKLVGLDLAEQDVGVGDGERPAAPVRGRPGVGAGALGSDPEPGAVERQDRAAACGDGVDRHHRRPHPHACHLRLEGPLELARVVRDVGRRPTHVEADDPQVVLPLQTPLGRSHHADDAARGPREDRVLALEAARLRQAARRLHELEPHARHLRRDRVDVAAEDRRQVRVDHRGVASSDELHQRARPVRDADLREPRVGGERRGAGLVLGPPPAVHEDDGDAREAARAGRGELPGERWLVEGPDDVAQRADPLVGLDDSAVEQFRQDDPPVEEARPVLVGDAERVAEALGDDQQRRLALALEQRVGGDGGAHLHRLDAVGRHRFVAAQPEEPADAGDRGVAVLLGVLGEELGRDERAVGAATDDVGERAAAVDPELPAADRGAHAVSRIRRADQRSRTSVTMSCTARPVAARTASA
jgi:hypothetical protein